MYGLYVEDPQENTNNKATIVLCQFENKWSTFQYGWADMPTVPDLTLGIHIWCVSVSNFFMSGCQSGTGCIWFNQYTIRVMYCTDSEFNFYTFLLTSYLNPDQPFILLLDKLSCCSLSWILHGHQVKVSWSRLIHNRLQNADERHTYHTLCSWCDNMNFLQSGQNDCLVVLRPLSCFGIWLVNRVHSIQVVY